MAGLKATNLGQHAPSLGANRGNTMTTDQLHSSSSCTYATNQASQPPPLTQHSTSQLQQQQPRCIQITQNKQNQASAVPATRSKLVDWKLSILVRTSFEGSRQSTKIYKVASLIMDSCRNISRWNGE
ncbi:uncharacterized protein LOC141885950 isoform X2 [Acropora palmata]|uniref:uncharacterized protein LOC141885950 isoform X2 n=1 Tax=Acropora palmata TaxID=6131 RepID=UPI003DA02E6B